MSWLAAPRAVPFCWRMPCLRLDPRFLALVFLAPTVRAADFGPRFDALAARATPRELYALLYEMPKGGDLHNHATGANRGEWMYEVCTDPLRNGGETFYTRIHFTDSEDAVSPSVRFQTVRRRAYDRMPVSMQKEFVPLASLNPDERRAWCSSRRLDGSGNGRIEFFSHMGPRFAQINTCLPVITELLVYNLRAFGAEHVAYVESQFTVEGVVDNEGRPIPTEEAVAFVRDRLARPDVAATGVTVRFQRTISRFAPDAEKRLADAYAFVDAHRDLWVGLNLAGIEENGYGYPSRFLDTFRTLRAHYPTLALSIHAGEMDGPDRHIRDTLILGASRIGHGINLIKDPDTLLLLQQTSRVLVEVNLISNHLLGYVPDLATHPFPEYLRTGVTVCLNTDDRGAWDSNMTDEYYTAVTLFHLSWAEMLAMGRASIQHAFVQDDVKEQLLAAYNARIAAFEARLGVPTVEAALADLDRAKPVTYTYAKRTWGFDFN